MAASNVFAGRVPRIRNSTSGRLMIFAALLVPLLVYAIYYGFHHRMQKNEQRKAASQVAIVASDASKSNRAQIEQPTETAPAAPNAGVGTRPSWLQSAPHITPTQGSPVMPGRTPVMQQPTTTPAPVYYASPAPVAPTKDAMTELREQTTAARYAREVAAIEAPTGIQEQRSTTTAQVATPTPASPLDELAQYRQMVGSANPAGAPAAGGPPQQTGFEAQNAQDQKRAFNEGTEQQSDYLATTRVPPLSRWVVQRGIQIPAILPQTINSDLPGDIVGQTIRDVYDSPTQKYVMIPAGSRLVGEYNSGVTYGQSRVQVVWTAIYFPDGSHVDLDRMPGHGVDGSVGLKDQTDQHYKRLIAGIALSSLFAAGVEISQNHSQTSTLAYPSNTQILGSAVGQQASQLGEQITTRNLNIQPTLKIRPGEVFSVSVKKDIVFPGPYEPIPVK